MSLTASERRNPPSRRRSCQACTRAKRRCDFSLPGCRRCTNRGFPCQYPDRRPTPAAANLAEDGTDYHTSDDISTAVASSPETLGPNTAQWPSLQPLCAVDVGLDLALSVEMVPGRHSYATVPDTSALSATPATLDNVVREKMRIRMQYRLDQTRKAPEMMARKMTTPWSHPLLYQDGMPKAIRDAHASCSMFMFKDDSNSHVIMEAIESFTDDLLRSNTPTTTEDHVAFTQALLLYLIIRLLDGDLHVKANAERQLFKLEEAAVALRPYVDHDVERPPNDILALHPLGPTKVFWRRWIVQESARRTLIQAISFIYSYRRVARIPTSCESSTFEGQSLTASAQLWNATTPAEFALAWNQKQYFIVPNMSFDQLLSSKAPEDLDDFVTMCLAGYMGIDEFEGWLISKRACLDTSRTA
ncbi:hypothetical protein F5X68DRAFT_44055 [Plectosphaerella plurivora]|uniref:Zn(2)-C6 fungal-type domain-containing protein n=1 Tax=Plectosphaerella plurivora TaxID=936078 RepID=A0A9P8V3C6_9PEZI|nr:hypothetical protein F5X68DRAFT_44055 [Plectosphaerella plurivora]